MFIGLTGVSGSGKDEVGSYLASRHGFERFAFADPLKEGLEILNPYIVVWGGREVYLCDYLKEVGWDEAKKHPNIRRLLQTFGTEVGRTLISTSVWIDVVFNRMVEQGCLSEPSVFNRPTVVTDVRFENEARAVRARGGHIVKVDRGRQPFNSHSSEAGIPDSLIDDVITNGDNLESLHLQIDSLVEKLDGRKKNTLDVGEMFFEARFSDDYSLGNGDIRLTSEMQDRILEHIKELREKR